MFKKIKPKQGQESVWDYPRPPKLEATNKHLIIEFNDIQIASTNAAFRVLETSHPPVYYLPQADIAMEYLRQSEGQGSFCEFKGMATYWDIVVADKSSPRAAWSYPNPSANFLPIANYLAFYASRVDRCFVDGELVQAQQGDFYGGWITKDIVGPFKGGAGTWGW
ncbi:MAG: DUF427 domain-containing protein [Bacteroidota bacterium]